MEAYRSHKNRYLALVALAFLFAAVFVAVSTASESDARGTVTLAPGDGGTVTADGNVVSNCAVNVTTYSYTLPEGNVPFKGSDGKEYVFFKPGYSLTKWEGGDRWTSDKNPGATANVYEDVTYIAKWELNKVTFDKNGGDFRRNNSTNTNNYYKADVNNLTVPGNVFTVGGYSYSYTREGYIFLGWSTEAGASYAQYTEGNTLPVPDRSYTLYAIWKKEITITYNENGGEVSPSRCWFKTYEDQTIPGNIFTHNNTEYSYTHANWTFLGWSTNQSATSPEYVSGDYLATGKDDITLYAVWDRTGCKIVFNPNGGSANRIYSPIIDAPLYIPGNSFNVDGVSYEYTNSGYIFLGWSRDSHATTPEYVKGNILPATTTGNVPLTTGYVLYAIWSPESSKIIFDYGNGVTAEVYVEYGYTFDSSAYMGYAPADKVGYKIVGWSSIAMSDTKDDSGAYSIPSGAVTYSRKITFNTISNITLYPIWAKVLTASSGSLELTSAYTGCYYVDNAAAVNGIVVNGGSPYIFIDNVTADFHSSGGSPFVLKNGANVNLTVMSDCYFKGQDNALDPTEKYFIGYAGINVQSGTTLTLDGNSLGKLTAEGGDASSYYYYPSYNTRHEIDGRAGAGIGANGNASDTQYDSGCGRIIINGGKVSAYGGDGLVDYRSYIDDDGYAINPRRANFDIVAAQGIGGTTSNTGINIQINGGTVTAATGHINGFTATKNNWQVNDSASKYRDPIYDGTEKTNKGYGSRTEISSNATVTLTSDSDVNVVGDYDTLRFTSVTDDRGRDCTIGSALSVTIDGTMTIDLGGASITEGTEIKIPAGLVSNGSTITLVTSFESYFTGNVTKSGNRYNVILTEPSDEAHGTVDVYVNEQSVGLGEAFGTISPNQAFTIRSSQSGATSITYPFTLNLNTGYQYVGVKFGTVGSNNAITWVDHELTDGESISTANNIITCILNLGLSSEGAGTANYVSFTIQKTTVKVTIKNTYSEGNISFYEKTFKTGTTDPSSLTWANEGATYLYTLGTQYVYYKDSLTCTIDVTRGENETANPFIVKWVTVNDVPLTPVYDQEHNKGQYTFTITDISEDTVIEVRYGPTVKLSGYITYPAGTAVESKYRIYVQGINADGTDGFLIEKSGTVIDKTDQSKTYVSCDVYVGKGSAAYFKIYSSGTKTVDGKTVEDWDSKNGLELGISKITVSATGIRDRSVYPNVENVYSLGTLYADTEINVLLTEIKWNLTFVSNVGGGDSTQYLVSVVDGTFYVIPDVDTFASLGLDIKTGYDLIQWNIVKSNHYTTPPADLGTDTCRPGTNMQITCDMVFTAVWSETPHQYKINYSNFDGGEFVPTTGVITTYTVETDTFNLVKPTRGGYTFKGWLTDENLEKVLNGELDIDHAVSANESVTKGTAGDLHYTVVWTGIDVEFTLKDVKGLHPDATQTFTVGSTFANLPIYTNVTKTESGQAKHYTFAGWSFKEDLSDRITDTDKVPYHENADLNIIYVIWVENSLYIINIQNDGSYGGTVSAAVFGTPGHPIVLTINAYTGFKATGVIINGVEVTNPPFDYVTSPYTYSYPTSDSSGIYYYTILVVFEKLDGEPVDYPEWHDYIYDGQEHTCVEEGIGYTVSDNSIQTDAGTYDVVLTLREGYIWRENYSDQPYTIPWTISPRTAFIIANSEVMKLSEKPESGWSVSSNSYVTLLVLDGDKAGLNISSYVGTKTSPQSTISDAGSYENKISYTASNNYDLIVIHGTYIVYEDTTSSTVVYGMIDTSSAASSTGGNESTVEPTGNEALSAIRMSTNTQSVVRRGRV